MSLPNIALGKGEIIVIKSDSYYGIVGTDVALNFGSVQLVNQLTQAVKVGDSIMFDINKAVPFQVISGVTFYLVKEDTISFSEPDAP